MTAPLRGAISCNHLYTLGLMASLQHTRGRSAFPLVCTLTHTPPYHNASERGTRGYSVNILMHLPPYAIVKIVGARQGDLVTSNIITIFRALNDSTHILLVAMLLVNVFLNRGVIFVAFSP